MIRYNNSAPNAVNNVGQFGATEGSIGAYKSAAEYAADSKYWAMLSQKNYNSIDEILKEVERLYAEGSLLKEDIEQLKYDFENQNQILLGLIQQTGEAIDNTNIAIGEANAATDRANQAVQDVLTQLDKISNMSVVATTLPPGAPATGSFDNSTGVFSFGIPEGQPGKDGKDGTDGTISDIGDVAISTPVADDYGFFVDKDNGGLYRTPMSEIANLVPAVVSFNGRTGPVVPTAGDYTVSQVTGAAASGVNDDINQIRGLTTALSVAQGGTAAKNADDARTNLSAMLDSRTSLSNTTNLNDLKGLKAGFYHQALSANAKPELNYPIQIAGSLLVQKTGADGSEGCIQTYYIFNNMAISYRRAYVGQGWSEWKRSVLTERVEEGGSTTYIYSNYSSSAPRLQVGTNGLWGCHNGTSWVPLTLAQGGTGATTAADSRTNLGLDRIRQDSTVTHMFTQNRRYSVVMDNNGKWGGYDLQSQTYVPLAVDQGGTGATTAEAARMSLVAAKSGDNSDITSMTNKVTFTQAPVIPDAVANNEPVSLGQLSNTSNAAQGDALIGVKAPFTGAAARTQHDINAQFSSILDFLGDKYDGTTDAAGSFIAANTLLPKSREILVPSGTYLLNSDVDCSGRRLIFEEPVTFTGTGKFYRAIVNRIMTDGTTRVSQWAKPGTTEYMTSSAVFGDNGATATGIQIGGAVPYNGKDGVMMFTDGSSGWLGVRASKWPHPTEMAIYPSSKAGACQTISGSNAVKILSGASITSEAIGKPVSIFNVVYTVASITADGFTVKNINGTPVTWGSTATHSYILCYYHGSGVCSVSGTTVTRISGDPFVIPDAAVPQTMTINGTDYRVVSFTDPQHVTLSSAPGDSASTEYKFWGTVNNLNTALRIHRLNAAGFEENISLIANNAGYFALHAAAGNPANEQYPLYIGSGWEDNGQMRKSIISAANGDVTLGGNYGNGPLYVPYNQTAGHAQVMVDNRDGNATVTVSGGPSNASLSIKAKDSGRVVFHSDVSVNATLYPHVDNVYSCGRSGNRWSQIWASNATIQTSDGTTKTEVQGSNLSTDFILGLNPVSYKNIVGGNVVEEIEDGVEEIERQVVEKVITSEEVHDRVVDGDEVYYVRKFVDKEVERPVFHEVDLRDELGNVIGTIKTPLMEKVTVPKTRQVITEVPGKRTHYGFIAQEVKDLVDKLGISDFGGYVEGEDGKLGLRYGEFISPIVSCLQDIIKRLELLEKE